MDKKDLLEHIQDYSPNEIAEAIRSEVVTFQELRSNTQGQFGPLLQQQVRKLLNAKPEEGQKKEEPDHKPLQPKDQPEPFHPGNQEPVDEPEPFHPGSTETEEGDPPKEVYPPEDVFTPVPEPVPSVSQGRLVPCPECGHMVSPFATECPSCGMPFTSIDNWPDNVPVYSQEELPRVVTTPPLTPDSPYQNGIMGPNAHLGIPSNLNSFSWGGFIFGWIWGLFNGVYWSLLTLIPIVNLVVAFALGFKGHRAAWESKAFASKEDFERIQRGWNIAGIIVFIFDLIMILLFVLYIIMVAKYEY